MSVDKESLFKTRLPEAEVEIEGLGIFRVRGLSRGEVFVIQQTQNTAVSERKILALGLLDPVLTEVEVGRWQEASPAGEMEPVTEKIRELSGLGEGSEKEAMLQFRDDPGSGVRVLPGAEVGNDGRPAPGADEQ